MRICVTECKMRWFLLVAEWEFWVRGRGRSERKGKQKKGKTK